MLISKVASHSSMLKVCDCGHLLTTNTTLSLLPFKGRNDHHHPNDSSSRQYTLIITPTLTPFAIAATTLAVAAVDGRAPRAFTTSKPNGGGSGSGRRRKSGAATSTRAPPAISTIASRSSPSVDRLLEGCPWPLRTGLIAPHHLLHAGFNTAFVIMALAMRGEG